jgi:hypothetical protein
MKYFIIILFFLINNQVSAQVYVDFQNHLPFYSKLIQDTDTTIRKDTSFIGNFISVNIYNKNILVESLLLYKSNNSIYERLYFDHLGKIIDSVTYTFYDSGDTLCKKGWIYNYSQKKNICISATTYSKSKIIIGLDNYDTLGLKHGVCESWNYLDTLHSLTHFNHGNLEMEIILNRQNQLVWIATYNEMRERSNFILFSRQDQADIFFNNESKNIFKRSVKK